MTIDGASFSLIVSADSGGKCDDGWCDEIDFDLSREEVMYKLHQMMGLDEVFEGVKEEEIDIEESAQDAAMEAAWPDGEPSAKVTSMVPEELEELAEMFDGLDINDASAVEEAREELLNLTDGDYNFYFDIDSDGYYIVQDKQYEISLSADEARGVLLGLYPIKKVFDGICDRPIDEDFINEKAAAAGFAEQENTIFIGCNTEPIDRYFEAWEEFVDQIFAGVITEDNLDDWLRYFEEEDFEDSLLDWAEYEDLLGDNEEHQEKE